LDSDRLEFKISSAFNMIKDSSDTETNKTKKFLKKIGWIGFTFFLLKGIAWIVFGYVGFSFFNSCN